MRRRGITLTGLARVFVVAVTLACWLLLAASAGGTLSRRGDLIAFDDRNGHLWAMRMDGSGLRRIVKIRGALEENPAWSPDGSWLVFDSQYLTRTKVFGEFLHGPHFLSIARFGENRARKLVKVPGDVDLEIVTPAWSPDGQLIAFGVLSSLTGFSAGGIYLVDRNGKHLRKIPGTSLFDSHPSWSPDGKTIVFEQRKGIAVVQIDGEGRHELTGGSRDYSPVWSPDGRLIAFSRPDKNHNDNIWVMKADGSDQQQLTGESARRVPGPRGGVSPGHALQPTWSPTGRRIAYAAGAGLWVMNADGSNQRPIRRNLQLGLGLASSWQP